MTSAKHVDYSGESTAVQAHLNIAQALIARMAANCAASKTWCITLVAAILVFVADKGKPRYAEIAAIPTVLFCLLDTYYLGLEHRFRDSYKQFIQKLHVGSIAARDLYDVTPEKLAFQDFWRAMKSLSVWPFYGTLALMIWLTEWIVTASDTVGNGMTNPP